LLRQARTCRQFVANVRRCNTLGEAATGSRVSRHDERRSRFAAPRTGIGTQRNPGVAPRSVAGSAAVRASQTVSHFTATRCRWRWAVTARR
jgi:hypothetical protein